MSPRKRTGNTKEAPPSPPVTSPTAAAYGDSQPFDQIQFLQGKLILKPDRFTSIQSFRDFGKLVEKSAKKSGVGFIPDPKASRRPEIR